VCWRVGYQDGYQLVRNRWRVARKAPLAQKQRSEFVMAKKKSMAREFVWLQCTESGDLNYRTSVNTKGGIPESLKEGMQKFSPRLRKHTLHKIKRK